MINILVSPSARRRVLKIDSNNSLEILDEKIIKQNNCLLTVRRWYKGVHPELGGTIIKGFTGLETVVEKTVIRPSQTFFVSHTAVEIFGLPVLQEIAEISV